MLKETIQSPPSYTHVSGLSVGFEHRWPASKDDRCHDSDDCGPPSRKRTPARIFSDP